VSSRARSLKTVAVGWLIEDPLGTAQIRERVLDAWAASPARFREDANAEEDLVLGGYRDRLLIELAQNAADAATAAGVPGHLRITLDGEVLRAANVGAPLNFDGVQGLSTLRASAKRGSDSVGMYGVGFAAVLAVSDEPTVVSRDGGVRFSAADTRAAVAGIPSLTTELARRGGSERGSVPILRLPFPVDASTQQPRTDFDTEVQLPLRPGAHDLVRAMLDQLSADVLLGLPGLTRLEIDGRVLRRSEDGPDVVLHDGDRAQRWRVCAETGELPAELLAGRPIEERERPQWTISWAVPLEDGVPAPLPGRQVLHAPTPSDEPLSLPLRLIVSYPLAPDRRHVAPGAVTDYLTAVAARVFGDLVLGLPAYPAVLRLLPRVGLAGAALDAAIGAAIIDELRRLEWLPETPGDPRQDALTSVDRVRPARATALDPSSDDLVTALADVIAGLLPASWSRRSDAPVLAALGIRRMDLASVIELVSTLDRPGSWWSALYAALERIESPDDRDALSAIPVPLTDGRMAYGARGLLLPDRDLGALDLSALGLRIVDPEALGADDARRLLERLGANSASAPSILASSEVQAAVEASLDDDDPEPTARAVLELVRAAESAVGDHPWFADLALPDGEGEWTPAGELVLPGSPLASVLDPEALGRVDRNWVAAYGPEPLVAVGVLAGFAVLRSGSADLGEVEHDLDAESRWYDAVFDRLPPSERPPTLDSLTAVRDLDLVRSDRWPAALRLLAQLPDDVFADTLVTVSASGPSGGYSRGDGALAVAVPSYTRWWLSTHPILAGQRPDRLRAPDAELLAGLFDVADVAPEILRLVHCLSTVDDAMADLETALELLTRLGGPDRAVRAELLPDIYPRLAAALDGIEVQPPQRVRVAPDLTVDRDRAVVLDAPYLLPLLDRIPVPAAGASVAVADLLDLPLATEIVTAAVTSGPESVIDWADIPGASLAARRLGLDSLPGRVGRHNSLLVTGGRPVSWWPEGDIDHVEEAAGPPALGRALAWRYDRWPLRAALAEAFAHPDQADRLDAEDASG